MSCSTAQQSGQTPTTQLPTNDLPPDNGGIRYDTINQIPDLTQEDPPPFLQDTVGIHDSVFVNMAWFGDAFVFDLRYATDNNFVGQTVYPCAVCKIRYGVAKALLKAAEKLDEGGGYKIKFFDCYRPVSVQRTFWEIYPDARYVANPNTTGSVHNKGAAVDITLVDAYGEELNMGTDFDHFDEEAHQDYMQFPADILANRTLLKETMESVGFRSIRTEWWHYNYQGGAGYGLANEPLCR
ncbi:MAG TPA: peptidase M15 [Cytophagales bacterium]|nr:peptidase M15 [Cytophagales bacterium]HAA17656.1 peptidase M15 [Cytophagales bacterium]HAP63170.1 peptidase M15 [Cytophagales bacterium]